MPEKPRISSTVLSTLYGNLDFFCFSWGKHEEDNLLCAVKRPFTTPTLVRIQSACYTAEIFRSLDCDCHEQLDKSLKQIADIGGLLVYMLCDGRGAGLYKKILGLELGRTEGLDTSDAYHKLGLEQDPREYDRVNIILDYFHISSIRLLTNNPRKVEALQKNGVTVIREPLEIPPSSHSLPYLQTKATKMGHMMSAFNKALTDK